MSRTRDKDGWLPERVYRERSGSYAYHPKGGGSKVIAKKNATPEEVLEAYSRLFNNDGTVGQIKNGYWGSETFLALAPRTQQDYECCWLKLKPVFEDADARAVRPFHIRTYMDNRGARRRANMERVLLQNIFSWGFERDYIDINPCHGVKQFKMKPRDRYVSDQEYQKFYDKASPVLQVFMELSYVCGARGQDIRSLKMSDIQDDGLLIAQGKTKKKQIKLWNDRLRAVVGAAKTLRKARLDKKGHDSIYLIVTSGGGSYTADGLKTLWSKSPARDKAMGWTFHDLKAKAISDFEGDKQNFSGHRSKLQMEDYNRSPDRTAVIDFKKT